MITLKSFTAKYFIDNEIARPAGRGVRLKQEYCKITKETVGVYIDWESVYDWQGYKTNEEYHAENAPKIQFVADGVDSEEKSKGNFSAYSVNGRGYVVDWVTQGGFYLEQKVGRNLYNGNDSVDFCRGHQLYIDRVLETLLCNEKYVPSQKPIFMLHTYLKEGFNGDVVLRMKLVNMAKALKVAEDSEYKVVMFGNHKGYKRLRIKLSALRKWSSKRQHNKDISQYLIENNIERDFTACIFNIRDMSFKTVVDRKAFYGLIEEIK